MVSIEVNQWVVMIRQQESDIHVSVSTLASTRSREDTMIDQTAGTSVPAEDISSVRPPREEVEDPTPVLATSYREWFDAGMPAPFGHLQKISKSKEKVPGVVASISDLTVKFKINANVILENVKALQYVELKFGREVSVLGQILSASAAMLEIKLFESDEEDAAYYAMLAQGMEAMASVFIETLEMVEDKHSRTTDAFGKKVAKGTGVVRLIPLDEFNRPRWSKSCTRIYWTECDGFVAPINFYEFIDKWPEYIRAFLVKRAVPEDMLDEFHQELACFLMHRGPEVRLQEKLLIQARRVIDPNYELPQRERLHRVSLYSSEVLNNNNNEKLFFNWLNFCMHRKLHQLWGERVDDPANPHVNDAFEDDPSINGGLGHGIADAYSSIDGTTSSSSDSIVTPYAAVDTKLFLQGFTEFVRRRKPELLVDLVLVMDYENLSEAARSTGRSRNQLLRNRQTLMALAQQYKTGTRATK
jgi:hypothetical protein